MPPKKAASAKKKQIPEKPIESEGVYLSRCSCRSCHASMETIDYHGSRCCFNATRLLEENVKSIGHPYGFCSAHCCMTAKKYFGVNATIDNLIRLFHEFDAQDLEYEWPFLAVCLLNTAGRDFPDAKIAGDYIPNYIAEKFPEDRKYVVFLAIYAGFKYTWDDSKLLKVIGDHISRKHGNDEIEKDLNARLEWLNDLFVYDSFRENVKKLFLSSKTMYNLDNTPYDECEDEEEEV